MKLKDIHNQTGFKVPKDYFNGLEDSILNEAKLKAKISNQGFKVPANYFDTLEDNIYSKLESKQPSKVKTIQLKPWIYAASIAASLALLLTLTFTNNHSNSISSLNNETIESFILSEDLHTSEMATLITDSDLFENNILHSAISDATIDHYIESEIDLEDLLDN